MPMQLYTEEEVYKISAAAGVNGSAVQKHMQDMRKDGMPADGRYNAGLYENSPFSFITGEITSQVISGGDPLMNWLPSRKVKSRTTHIPHLDWVAPKNFNGVDQSYAEYLAGVVIGQCGYGPSTAWSGFEYIQSGGTFSWTTDMMTTYQDGGLKLYEEQPQRVIRGPSAGLVLSSDREWAVARVLIVMETHLGYVLKHGNVENSEMEWDGIDQIIRPGYVQARMYGKGTSEWADPIWHNGAAISTAATLLNTIRWMVRLLNRRASDRNWGIQPGDMVVYMSQTMWDNLAESVAAGAAYAYTNQFGFEGQMSFKDYREEYFRIKSGGLGFGTLDLDGSSIPILTDGNLGANTTLDTGGGAVPSITGDVYILTRRAGGMTFLEQQYIDWADLNYPAINEDQFALQDGVVRAGWITEANKCFYYYGEMAGRLATYMQPMQARINNVTIPTLGTNENEAGAFYSPDYYATGQPPQPLNPV